MYAIRALICILSTPEATCIPFGIESFGLVNSKFQSNWQSWLHMGTFPPPESILTRTVILYAYFHWLISLVTWQFNCALLPIKCRIHFTRRETAAAFACMYWLVGRICVFSFANYSYTIIACSTVSNFGANCLHIEVTSDRTVNIRVVA